MTIKIKAPRAWTTEGSDVAGPDKYFHDDTRVRIVREADWRKLMKLVKAVESFPEHGSDEAMFDALDALKEKKK